MSRLSIHCRKSLTTFEIDVIADQFVRLGSGFTLADVPRAAPILARANDWDLIELLHVEQITVNADQQRAFARCGSTQHGYVRGVSANLRGQISWFNYNGDATKERSDRVGLAFRETEFLEQFSGQLFEDEFGSHQFMVKQHIFKQLGADARSAYMRRYQYGGI